MSAIHDPINDRAIRFDPGTIAPVRA